MPINKQLDQKVALITSSAPGICANTAQQFAQAGARVVVCGRNARQGLATVKQIRSDGGRATFVLADVAAIADVQSVIDETIATYGRLDILFNNVSNSYAQDDGLMEVSELMWDRIVEPLLKGTFFCCQYALPFLQQSSEGTIINLIEQTADSQGSLSAVCQGGVLALTRAIAQQFSASTVTANLVWATPAALPSVEAADVGLLFSKVLTGPQKEPNKATNKTINESTNEATNEATSSDRPFTDMAEAIMYLARYDSTLHGAALLVNLSDLDSFR
ncbi:MAG: SDR family NAD(P)-dependent oxidoreductase [Phormidesmis sp.]